MALLKAFLQHSKVDRWHIFLPSKIYANLREQCRGLLEHLDSNDILDKVDFFRDYDLVDCLSTVPYWAFQLGDPLIGQWLQLREAVSPKLFPITGVTHSLDSLSQNTWRQEIVFSTPTPADAVVCSCEAGKQVMQRVARTLLPEGSAFEQNLTVIPLAVEDPYEQLPQNISKEQAKEHLGLPSDRPLVLVLGRITLLRKADLHPLLVAIKMIKDDWPQDHAKPVFLIA
ncbi:MAG: hypothetical protein B7X06_02685, partial [Verrucomicrobia bacterium 21-51-4]